MRVGLTYGRKYCIISVYYNSYFYNIDRSMNEDFTQNSNFARCVSIKQCAKFLSVTVINR